MARSGGPRGRGGGVPPEPFHNPFADLGRKLGVAPAPGLAAPAAPPAPPPAERGPPPPARAVVRLERKGRGGKTATVVEKLGLPPSALAEWLLDLKRSLGCGAPWRATPWSSRETCAIAPPPGSLHEA